MIFDEEVEVVLELKGIWTFKGVFHRSLECDMGHLCLFFPSGGLVFF